MLGRVPNGRDKRQSSVIYNALAPMAVELAEANIAKTIFAEQSSLLTATGENLENWAANFGMTRKQATFAVRIAEMFDTDGNPIDLPPTISRFSTPNTATRLNYTLTAHTDTAGQSYLTCETAGTVGNAYLGALLPLSTINNLGRAAMIGTLVPAEDTETDDALRSRIIERINQESFGGNIAAYKAFTKAIDGVGDVKVFPVWDGGGTVKLSIVDAEYLSATSEFINIVQTEIDPLPNSGEGLGIAPIGHRVTVATPNEISITVTATVSLAPDYTITQLQASFEHALKDYILEARQSWADAPTTALYIARVSSAIINIAGVNNVAAVSINGVFADLILSQSAEAQQVPIFGAVVISNA